MNILPKKSWHVRTKKNIERVRRDEEKAAEEEKERQRRIALAEQESRTEVLRQRSKKRKHDQIEATSSSGSAAAVEASSGSKVVKTSADISLMQGGHLNFFKDIEEGLRREGKNKEHEAERAAEKEKWEKNIGLLTYLGQSAIESQNDRPWYLQQSEAKNSTKYEIKQSKREDRDQKLKDSMDPLREMRKHLEKHHKRKHHHKEKSSRHATKHGKHSHHQQTSSTKSTPSSSSSSSSQSQTNKKSKTMEELRAERLRREAAEKQKAAAVVARARGESSQPANDADDFVTDADRDRSRGYNSRYNPDFVKPMSRQRR